VTLRGDIESLKANISRCPHCERPGIDRLGKLISSESMPVRCKTCGGLSALSSFPARLLTELLFVALVVVGIIATLNASLLLLLGGVAIACMLWVAGSLLLPVTVIKRREFKVLHSRDS